MRSLLGLVREMETSNQAAHVQVCLTMLFQATCMLKILKPDSGGGMELIKSVEDAEERLQLRLVQLRV